MRRGFVALALLAVLAGCQTLRPAVQPGPAPACFVVFFASGSAQLSPKAREIVEQAAAATRGAAFSRIEIGIPPDAEGGAAFRERRFMAIQNVLSASAANSDLNALATLSDASTDIPEATDRAEIRLLP